MIRINPDAEIKFEHSADFTVAEAGRIVAVSRNGFATILNSDLSSDTLFAIPERVAGVSISSTGGLEVVAQEPAKALLTGHKTKLPGTGDKGKLAMISPSTSGTIEEAEGSYKACRFSSRGELWSVAALDASTLAIEVRDPASWQVLARTEMRDPFGDSYVDLLAHPGGTHMVVYSAGGQGFAWARQDGASIQLVEDPVPKLNYTTPPRFNAAGGCFLVVADENLLREYRFPDGLLLGEVDIDVTEGSLYQAEYAGSDSAIVNESMKALHLVDIRKGDIDRILIDGGHPEPKLGESQLLYLMANSGAGFASVHGELPFRANQSRPNTIMTWRIFGAR